MKWYQFGDKNVLLHFDTPDGQIPPEYIDSRFMDLGTRTLTSDAVYVIIGDVNDRALAITFAQGKKDAFAAITVLYVKGKPYVYYPGDCDWLPVLDYVASQTSKQQVLQTATYVMKYSVGKSKIDVDDFCYISSLLQPYVFNPDVYWTMLWWMVWFYYACIAEENYISPAGNPTQLGGLVKLVALIEHSMEGWSVRDACDHYKVSCYGPVYNETGSIVQAVREKCGRYGVFR